MTLPLSYSRPSLPSAEFLASRRCANVLKAKLPSTTRVTSLIFSSLKVCHAINPSNTYAAKAIHKRFTETHPYDGSPGNWCTGEDSNLRSSQGAADLQSAAINHSATCAIAAFFRRHNLTPALDGLSLVAFNPSSASQLSLPDTTKTGAREQTSAPRANLSENPAGVRFGKIFPACRRPVHHPISISADLVPGAGGRI